MKLLHASLLATLCFTACSKESNDKPDAQSSQKENGSGSSSDARQAPGTVKIELADQQ